MITNLRVLQLPVPFGNRVSIAGPGGIMGTILGLESVLPPPVSPPSLCLSALSRIKSNKFCSDVLEPQQTLRNWLMVVAVQVQGVK